MENTAKQIQEQAEKIQTVLKFLDERIKSIVNDGEDLNEASWNYQLGVLISGNDAKTILEAQWMQEREKWIKWDDFKANGGTDEMLNDYCLVQFDNGDVKRFGEQNWSGSVVKVFIVPSPPKD